MMRKPVQLRPRILIPTIASMCWLPSLGAAQLRDVELKSFDKTVRLSDFRGQYLAIYVMPSTTCRDCADFITAQLKDAPGVAGLKTLFVVQATQPEVEQFAKNLSPSAAVQSLIFADPDGSITKTITPEPMADLKAPATILFSPEGNELLRHVPTSETDALPFERLVRQVRKASLHPNLSEFNLDANKPAIQGYDPVSYFESKSPSKGTQKYESAYRGVTYWFASDRNRAAFAADPEKFVPAYGGWCATAMADGKKVEIDPNLYKIVNGRLMLFYNGWLGDALKSWNKDEAKLLPRADQNWLKIAPADKIPAPRKETKGS